MSSVSKLIEAPAAIEAVALAIAEDAYPGLRAATYISRLDDMAKGLAEHLEGTEGLERVEAFTDYVYGELGFQGNTDDYYDPRNSYLNDVLERRLGIPISLAVVLMALGRRVGLEVEGVGFPGHFIVRVGGEGGVFLDPFTDGQVLERDDLLEIARRALGEHRELAPEQLEPVDTRSMAVRMLFNLQNIYERRGDHARALVACDRLCEVSDAPFHLRDRGVHALALGAVAAAVEDLESYLEVAPEAADHDRIEELLAKASMREPAQPN